ncbi:hypothetical protein ACFYVL_02100 [Streptomyces sp. NPDC004111]|uniref:hypothetical protein n=1 Tax=Streptomyces sp. NPDC004111 TaxID=3364690 RepID=UPI0036885482
MKFRTHLPAVVTTVRAGDARARTAESPTRAGRVSGGSRRPGEENGGAAPGRVPDAAEVPLRDPGPSAGAMGEES